MAIDGSEGNSAYPESCDSCLIAYLERSRHSSDSSYSNVVRISSTYNLHEPYSATAMYVKIINQNSAGGSTNQRK